ncbi:MAG: GNAT family N-acetyltransferase [Acidimicrobiales bacterium]|nr:GNAT family N-acetyltransferase [Acidimicrobiales bacterium]
MEAARHATAADVDSVASMVRQVTDELRVNRGGAVWSVREAHPEPVEGFVAEAITGPDRVVVVGTVDEVVVGYGMMAYETLHDGSVLAGISDLYVDPTARCIGVGEAMMDLLEHDARAAGAIGLDSFVLPGDRASKNFFETFGLTARAILVHRSFDDTGPVPEST